MWYTCNNGTWSIKVFINIIFSSENYDHKCDIWSLGVIFYEMVFSDVPWKGRDERDLLKNILSVPLALKKGFLS